MASRRAEAGRGPLSEDYQPPPAAGRLGPRTGFPATELGTGICYLMRMIGNLAAHGRGVFMKRIRKLFKSNILDL